MQLVFNEKDRKTFHSGRWNRHYNPDLCIVSKNKNRIAIPSYSTVLNNFSRSQHKPILKNVGIQIPIVKTIQKLRWNFRKADWHTFAKVTVFHFNNKKASQEINISFIGQEVRNIKHPKYLGVVLDRALTYREYLTRLSAKVKTCQRIISKLSNSTFAIISAFYSRSTPLKWLPVLSNIAPPKLRRKHALLQEWKKYANNPFLPIHTDLTALEGIQRLKSPTKNPDNQKLVINPTTKQPGFDLERNTWVTLNRIRTGHMVYKWRLHDNETHYRRYPPDEGRSGGMDKEPGRETIA
ncbi:Uncharacterized protein FWK35_00004245 [Aphis craccivora]|uniref:Uncharacterized protein n=1 Tax=Aphis craccivora TaxID=307492 RepID=A0A6G0ZB74_APHCR|nr:Uncharacterized protein FWK35_00004245 [Aphis craccivora]